MENSMNKLTNVQGTTDVANQQQTGIDTDERLVDELQSYKQKLLLRENRIKQLTIENNKLKDEIIALRAAQNDEYQSRIHDSVLQLNNFNEKDLDEDCWLKIFSYLSFEDMMQVERVCEKWYQVSRQWFKQVQAIQFYDYGNTTAKISLCQKYYEREIYVNIGILIFDDLVSFLHSYGHHIKYIRVNFYGREGKRSKESKKFIFQWVPKLCKNIVDVQIYAENSSDTPFTFDLMAKHWKKLEKLDIGQWSQLPTENNFLKLLRNNEQLKTFTCHADFSVKNLDNFFTHLPTTIEKIKIKHSDKETYHKLKFSIFASCIEQLSHFIFASKNFTSLKSLELSHFRYLSIDMLAAIANIHSLTHLNLNRVAYECPWTIELIANLKGLKSLYLAHNEKLHEASLINIVESCIQLEWLVITYDVGFNRNKMYLTDKGMDAIAKLKRLKCLEITVTHVTIGSIINLCDRLEVLRCHDWRFNNSDTIKLLKRATNLRLMDIKWTINLTEDILQAANEIANQRKNKILCMVGYGNSRTKPFEVINTPYFKYYGTIEDVPLEIFPNDMRNFIR